MVILKQLVSAFIGFCFVLVFVYAGLTGSSNRTVGIVIWILQILFFLGLATRSIWAKLYAGKLIELGFLLCFSLVFLYGDFLLIRTHILWGILILILYLVLMGRQIWRRLF